MLVPWVSQPTWSFYRRTKNTPGAPVVGAIGEPLPLLVPVTGDDWNELVVFAGGDPARYRVARRWLSVTELTPISAG